MVHGVLISKYVLLVGQHLQFHTSKVFSEPVIKEHIVTVSEYARFLAHFQPLQGHNSNFHGNVLTICLWDVR